VRRRTALEGLAQLWKTDRSLSVLLALLVIVLFVFPAIMVQGEGTSLMLPVVFQVFVSLIFVTGVVVSTSHRGAPVLAGAVMGTAIVLFWIHHVAPHLGVGVWKAASGTLAGVFLIVFVLQRVVREGPVTLQRIQGAVAVYLLLGLAFANAYELIERLRPGAFHLPHAPASSAELTTALAYFSFVTLTTVGYGDTLPVHPAARSAAVLEALVGQLFPAILIARLVAMELASREDLRRPR
jgi:voltage-gated potassium channel Kch